MTNLGGFSDEALQLFQLAASEQSYEFSEEGETYDFTRCMRPNGTFYGTRGKCKSGSEAGAADTRGTGRKGADAAAEKARSEGKKGGDINRARAQGRKDALAASRKAGGAKVSANNSRARLLKEELEKVKDKMRGASPEEQNRLISEASKNADRRQKAGEGKKETKPRATSTELRDSQRKLYDEAKAKRAAAKEAEKAAKQVAKETKGDKSKEARQRRMEAGRAWDKAATAADRAQRAWEREHERWSKSSARDEKKKMSPAQRAETRRVEKIIKERG